MDLCVKLPLLCRVYARSRAVMVGLAFLVSILPAQGAATDPHDTDHPLGAHAPSSTMSDSHMEAWVDAWFASHPRVGESSSETPVDTFRVEGFLFDANHSAFTQVDTVHISVGETVLWLWVSGAHTVTSGASSEEPGAGALFDREINSSAPEFAFTFLEPGVVPFFCRPHEGINMKGVVIVESNTGVEAVAGGPHGLGFTRGPWPNPTRNGTRFEFGLHEPGRVRLELFDVRGRRVASILDQSLSRGGYIMSWDGRGRGGRLVEPGVYFARLSLPGHTQSRRLTVMR